MAVCVGPTPESKDLDEKKVKYLNNNYLHWLFVEIIFLSILDYVKYTINSDFHFT